MTNGLVLRTLAVVIAASVISAAAAQDPAIEKPKVIIEKPYVPQEPEWEGELIAFVGKRVRIKETGATDLDEVFEARYRVLQVVHGEYSGDTIEFEVYDHYGYPQFGEYETALLFVVKIDGKYFHEQYLFNPVFPTTDGRWAGCGDPYEREKYPASREIEPHVTNFVAVKIRKPVGDGQSLDDLYPRQDFLRSGQLATCKRGAYAEELFEITRHGVLARRGYKG